MRRFRIAHLMLVVLFAAVAAAGLRYANHLWAAALVSGAMLTLATALVLALFATGPGRRFWAGFAVFGLLYALLAFPILGPSMRTHLLTTKLFDLLYDRLLMPPGPATVDLVVDVIDPSSRTMPNVNVSASRTRDRLNQGVPLATYWHAWSGAGQNVDDVQDVGHALFIPLLGLGGGLLAARVAGRAVGVGAGVAACAADPPAQPDEARPDESGR